MKTIHTPIPSSDTSRWRRVLLSWYETHKRDLPWRDIHDPYRIWVSEIILQQTRVAQGWDYYLRFIQRFPDVQTLAEAAEDDVLHVWKGLGYYSRARNMQVAARQMQENGIPTSSEGWKKLKGVGDYTSAAVASFAFGEPIATVDGNVYRVLSRYFDIDLPIDTTIGKRYFASLAQALLDPEHPAAYNQALMDFGALQCVPKTPNCEVCPLYDSCPALAKGCIDERPVKQKRIQPTTRYLTYFCLLHKDQIWIHRRGSGDIWQGLYEPLLIETSSVPHLDTLLQKLSLPTNSTLYTIAEQMKHVLTHRIIYANAYAIHLPSDSHFSPSTAKGQWVPWQQLHEYAQPRLIERIFERLQQLLHAKTPSLFTS